MGPPVVTAVIINFRTPQLVQRATESFRDRYPDTPLLLIDNGSGDGSDRVIDGLQQRWPASTTALRNPRNLHHGPAMDQALRRLASPFVFFLDSDCEILKGGVLEGMLASAGDDPRHYAVGKKIFMNRRGFDIQDGPGAIPYIRPICLLIRRDPYLELPPFERHGAPCLRNMREAAERGLSLIHFPVEDFILHAGRGTAGVHGYRLGMRGKLNHLLNRLGL